jgi:uncharacterized protein
MNRRDWVLRGAGFAMTPAALPLESVAAEAAAPADEDLDKVLPDQLLLKDYRPKSIYKVPVSEIQKAKFPVIDCHHHAAAKTQEDVDREVQVMDAAGVESACAFCQTGANFDRLFAMYSKYPKRFHIYCGLDMRGVDQPGFGPATLAELERCHQKGAVGVGEITDKGMGIGGVIAGTPNWQGTRPAGGGGQGPQERPAVRGFHPDEAGMDAIWHKCADLGMPVGLHVSDPYWSYLPQNRFNDGLMNGFSWRLDNKTGIMGHDDLVASLDRALARHPKTVFVACHLVNLDYDLNRLGEMFDSHPNLYADISARFHETCTIPRTTAAFLGKYGHRVTYGTDIPYSQHLFSLTYRILESTDEHFYDQDFYFNFNYHWPMYGMGLPDKVLKNVYGESMRSAFRQAQANAKA